MRSTFKYFKFNSGRDIGYSMLIKAGSGLLGLLSGIIVARILGLSHFGVYAFFNQLLTLAIGPFNSGMGKTTMRTVASSNALKEWGLLKGALAFSTRAVLAFSLIVLLLVALFFALGGSVPPEYPVAALLFAVANVPFNGYIAMKEMALRGLGFVTNSQLFMNILTPALSTVAVISFFLVLGNETTVTHLLAAQLIASVVVVYFIFRALQKRIPDAVRDAEPEYQMKGWARSASLQALSASIFMGGQAAPVLLLGFMSSSAQVGLFRSGWRMAEMVTILSTAVITVIYPRMIGLYKKKEMEEFARLMTHSLRLTFGAAVVFFLVYVLFAEELITMLFGAEFSPAATPLLILAGAHMLRVAGLIAPELHVISGREHEFLAIVTICSLTSVGLNFLLIPTYGANGAAIATGTALVLQSLLFALSAYFRLGIKSTIFGAK